MNEKSKHNKPSESAGGQRQVEVRLVGQTRAAVEAALAQLQATAGVQVQRWPRQGRRGEWLVYATLDLPAPPTPPAC